MTCADFVVLRFDQMIGMSGMEETDLRTFDIDAEPVGDAYMLIQAMDVQNVQPEIEVEMNGETSQISMFEPAGSDKHQFLLHVLPAGRMRKGTNSLRLRRRFYPELPDSFQVLSVIVHWRQVV